MMELLCTLGWNVNCKAKLSVVETRRLPEEQGVVQDHLSMLTNKLMCHPDLKIKSLGIIGAIKIVSSLVVNIELESDLVEMNFNDVGDIPEGKK